MSHEEVVEVSWRKNKHVWKKLGGAYLKIEHLANGQTHTAGFYDKPDGNRLLKKKRKK